MTQLQKLIKFAAMAFAIFLAVAIIGGIVSVVAGLSFAVDVFTSVSDKLEVSTTEVIADFDDDQITALEIDLTAAELRIETGTTLQASSNKSGIRVKQSGNTIVIEEEEHTFWEESGIVTLTVPQDFSFLTVEMDAGAGKIKVDVLRAVNLSLSLDAGEAMFEQLIVLGSADVETGAGKLVIGDGMLTKLDLELGVGKAEICSVLGDGSRVECGVGALELTLHGTAEDYAVHAKTGLGRFTIDGNAITDDTTVGTGVNAVKVIGGVGSVDVEFA